MKCFIFESLSELNEFLKDRNPKDIVDIKYQSQVVGKQTDLENKNIQYEVVDRFLLIVK